MDIKSLNASVRSAYEAMEAAVRAIEEAGEDADLPALELGLDNSKAAYERALKRLDDAKMLDEAKRSLPVDPVEDDKPDAKAVDARVGKEPLTYERHAPNSIFRDMYHARQGDTKSRERLERHAAEMAVEQSAEQRALNSSDSTGGEFIPPVWLQDQWIALPRAGRPVANTLNHVPLPPNTDTINLPKVSTGTAVAVQTDGNAVQSTDLATTSVTGAVQTIAGQQDVSQQLVDLSAPGIDKVIFDDISRAYDTQIETKVISGTVTNAKGLTQVSSINSVTYTDASPTYAELHPKIAQSLGLIHTNRLLPAQVIAMSPTRWAWVLSSVDSTGRPLVVPQGQPGFNAAGLQDRVAAENLVGNIQGLPVVVSASIPTNGGASTNQDSVLVYRGDDIYLYESAPRLRVFEEVLSNTLQVRFQIYGYYAIIAGRLPKAITAITGTGLVDPSF